MASAQPLGAPSQQRPLQPSPLSQATSANTQQQQQRYAVAAPAQQQQQQQQTGPHLLSLKVMRASAPALATSEKPYYDDLDFSSANNLLRSVGKGIQEEREQDLLANHLPGSSTSSSSSSSSAAASFPVSNLLILPNSFGTLYLGETFRTYLCVRNESSTAVREPSLRVEMQVGSSDPQTSAMSSSAGTQAGGDGVRWNQLAHLILPSPTRYSPDPSSSSTPADGEQGDGRPVWELNSGQALETSLGYDIKDLGPHVLVCTVGYKSSVSEGLNGGQWVERSFRKFYKFSVDRSPISVRTKVHHPRNASSLFHPDLTVRKKVELEVQVQNVTGNGSSLVFNGVKLKPSTNWVESKRDEEETKRQGGELLADGDIRQYLFVLHPSSSTSLGSEAEGIDMGTSPEGFAIKGDPLGSLDISWRMSLGEAGRLQTSQLVRRRVYVPPVSCPALPASASRLNLPAPQLGTQLVLLPETLDALRRVKVGDEEVVLGVEVGVVDVSGAYLPERQTAKGTHVAGMLQGEGETLRERGDEDDDDDDTPLSEIASSPKSSRRSAPPTPAAVDEKGGEEAGEIITIHRTLRLALQHCSIEPPHSQFNSNSGLAGEAGEVGPATPRKQPTYPNTTLTTPIRTSTPTQTAMPTLPLSLGKSRLQANLSNLVRNTSLSSLRPSRGSVDVSSSGGGGGGGGSEDSRSSTPTPGNSAAIPPAVPPKTGLAPSATVTELQEQEKEEEKEEEEGGKVEYPTPTLSWGRVEELYASHVEGHAQALSRPHHVNGQPIVVPSTFLPTPEKASFEGNSLIFLPATTVQIRAWQCGKSGKLFRLSNHDKQDLEGTSTAQLRFALNAQQEAKAEDGGETGDVVRFGALRVLLLGYTDQVSGQERGAGGGGERECMTILQEIPVFAEALLMPS